MNKNKNYIICGIPPGNSGVGRVLKYLIKYNCDNFYIIYPKIFYPEVGLRTLIKKKQYLRFIKYYLKSRYSRIIDKFIFYIKVNSLNSKNMIIIHPQTIGFKNIIKLIKKNNIFLYTMDCSFFCVKSYNHIESSFKPCLLCLGGNYKFAKKYNCKPFPVKYKLNENINFLKKIKGLSNNINFIVQNPSQLNLLKKHFGNDIKAYVVPIFAEDFAKNKNLINKKNKDIEQGDDKLNIDFVYHGAAIEAKGLLYVINIASILKQYTFLIPVSYGGCKKVLGQKLNERNIRNVIFKDITWENGLKDYVTNSKAVLCPSLWSEPIAGALIKSFIFNGVVALVPSKYSFANDLPSNIYCKLDVDSFNKTIKVLTELIGNNNLRANLKRESQKWVNAYLEENKFLVKKLAYIVNNCTDNQI
jgi:hypothetical protein